MIDIIDLSSTFKISSTLLSTTSSGIVLLRIPSSFNLSQKRRRILDDTRRLLPRDATDKEATELKLHGLIPDVPKSTTSVVSSAACQVCINNDTYDRLDEDEKEEEDDEPLTLRKNIDSISKLLQYVISIVCKSCDEALGLVSSEKSLSNVLAQSKTAKARMIYYHAKGIVSKDKEEKELRTVLQEDDHDKDRNTIDTISTIGTWQNWHYDYGLFTALISPELKDLSYPELSIENEINSEEREESSSYGGLVVLSTDMNSILHVPIPSNTIAIQVGEAASILTGGRLKACLHCVARPTSSPSFHSSLLEKNSSKTLTRQIFVLFAQPSWSQILQPLDSSLEISPKEDITKVEETNLFLEKSLHVPPLSHRYIQSMTFSEFAAKTTKSYYGKTGKQGK